MRRRALLTSIATSVAVGTAGCTSSNEESDTTNPRDSTTATTANTSRTTEPAEEMLRFGDRVGDEIRERCERALDRTVDITGEHLDAPVRIELRDPNVVSRTGPRGAFAVATGKATHLRSATRPDRAPGSLGRYNMSNRVITLTDTEQIDVDSITEQEAVPDISLENYPNEPHIAHELTHAIQYDVTDVSDGSDPTNDGQNAVTGVREGTATYVEGRYRANCIDGEYDPCILLDSFRRAVDVPLWMLPRRIPYVNGALFAYEAVERGGYDQLWEKHGSPPETAAAIMFPKEYFETGITYRSVDVPNEASEEWNRVQSTRMGVNALYSKFVALDIASLDDSDAAVEGEAAETVDLPRAYRSDLLRKWHGDSLAAYSDGDGRVGYRWRTAWETDARTVADAVAEAYDDRGEARDGGWLLDGDFVTVASERTRDGERVTFAGGPDRDAVMAILGRA
ncbi:hypothetical protein [Halostella pelagica]|uniref:hypothetical protein n=1 Tax=Halostella pelagica TaxID=2583824 RepID=UPI001080A7B9|nr:hypothetical protein [Halostella pelagica]